MKEVQTVIHTMNEERRSIMSDKVKMINSADPVKAYQAIAKIIGEKEGLDIKLKCLTEKKKDNAETTNKGRRES